MATPAYRQHTTTEELFNQHRETNNLLEDANLWNLELTFFENILLNRIGAAFSNPGKPVPDHFLTLTWRLKGELEELISDLSVRHRSLLAFFDNTNQKQQTQNLDQQGALTVKAEMFDIAFKNYKRELLALSAI